MNCKDCKFTVRAFDKFGPLSEHVICTIQLPVWLLKFSDAISYKTVYTGEYGGNSCDLGQPKDSE
jgi:hypothetical protein